MRPRGALWGTWAHPGAHLAPAEQAAQGGRAGRGGMVPGLDGPWPCWRLACGPWPGLPGSACLACLHTWPRRRTELWRRPRPRRRAELVEAPNLEEIVHYDQWARRFVADKVGSKSAVAA